jgi:hypothetical protein
MSAAPTTARDGRRVLAFNAAAAMLGVVVVAVAVAVATEAGDTASHYGKVSDITGEALGGVLLYTLWVLPMVAVYHGLLAAGGELRSRRMRRALAVAVSPVNVAIVLAIDAYDDVGLGGFLLTLAPAVTYGFLVRLPGDAVPRSAVIRTALVTVGAILALAAILVVSSLAHS